MNPGTITVQVSATDVVGQVVSGQQTVTYAPASAYATWTVAVGLTPGVNDGPECDANGDGLVNR